ncbi:MAG: class I SAM-dependent methyltransferase [Deltaproteobacteria bacterium]|nr:class I SAM-dependent methyltransferase [Deltaproteobacteria bacterium]
MAFSLEQVVPWGRSFAEYEEMFALGENDLLQRILGCGDGPAGFNSVLTARGGRVVSADPLYCFSAAEIRGRIAATSPEVLEQARLNREEFVWDRIRSVEELERLRLGAMELFLSDYAAGLQHKRYREAALPRLPFADDSFDIALCSHFLFLYSEHFSEDFHVQSILELCRVAAEARIFPLLELGSRPSRHLEPVLDRLAREGCDVLIETVTYEFQKGGNKMLRVQIRSENSST